MSHKVTYKDAHEHCKLWGRDCMKMFEACERILEAKGQPVRIGRVGGWCGVPTLTYDDGVVNISRSLDNPSLDVTILEGVTEHGLANPVYCRNKAGKTIRTHGEWIFIAKHIWDLAQELDQA